MNWKRIALVSAAMSFLAVAMVARILAPTISGVVRDVGGRPIGGARVAAAATTSSRAFIRHAISDHQGRYRLRWLLPATFSVSAVLPDGTATAVNEVALTAGLHAVRDLTFTRQPRVLLRGAIADGRRGAVVAERHGIRDHARYVVETDAEGRYALHVPPGHYSLYTARTFARSPSHRLPITGPAVVDLPVPNNGGSPDDVTEWARANAIPLTTVDPGHGFEDMEPLASVIGDARVVGMGEATHGTRDFFRFKHRMFEFLVERLGFTHFAIEASMPDCLAIDDYVHGGPGDAATLVAGMGFWTWNTQEVVDLVEWMRRYNAHPGRQRKVSFAGFDMQAPDSCLRHLRRYLQQVDAEAAEALLAPMAPLANFREYGDHREVHERVRAATGALAAHLDRHRPRYEQRSSAPEWRLARRLVTIVTWAETVSRDPRHNSSAVRDEAMAANVRWLLEGAPPGARMMLWAHNGHVTAEDYELWSPMGRHLRRMFGERYVAVGFSFHRGSFNARMENRERTLRSFGIGPAKPDSLEGALHATGIARFAVDLRRAQGGARSWLDHTRPHRSIGASYSPMMAHSYRSVIPGRSFDVVVFLAETEASRLLPRPKR